MNNVKFVQIIKSFAYLEEHIDKFLQFSIVSLIVLFCRLLIAVLQKIPKIASITVLGDDIKKLAGLT